MAYIPMVVEQTNRGERSYDDIELAEAFNRADDSTRQAIRLLLGLK